MANTTSLGSTLPPTSAGAVASADAVQERRRRIGLKIVAALLFSLGPILGPLFLLDSPLVQEGTPLALIFRWHPYNKAYESMIIGMYMVMGVMLWRAAARPREHILYLDFLIWANIVHAVVMLAFAVADAEEIVHAVGDVLILGVVVAALLWLRPRDMDAERARTA